MSSPLVSVVVVSFNTCGLLRDGLRRTSERLGVPHEIVVVDNASHDGSPEMVAREFPEVRLIRNPENVGFGRANNQGMAAARAEVFILLNSDAWPVDHRLGALAARLAAGEPGVGVLGPRLLEADGRLQASAYHFLTPGRLALEELLLYKLLTPRRRGLALLGGYWAHDQERDVDWVVGACMVVRGEVFRQTGGFDPSIFLYGEEEEWCERIRRAGWRVVFSPTAEVTHVSHQSSARALGEELRIVRTLRASDELLRRRSGRGAVAVGGLVRVVGAALRGTWFGLRRLRRPDDPVALSVSRTARVTLRHYLGRG